MKRGLEIDALIREQHGELPEHIAADFERTLYRTHQAILKISKIPLHEWIGEDAPVEGELDAAVSSLEENSRALESIFQTLVIQVNMMAASDRISAIEESATHPSLPSGGQSTEKQQVSEGSPARHATDEVKQKFVLPSILKFVGFETFVRRLPILD
ncbi:hypothetical protein C8034_v010961 [Colletotrichum sidae]|uniref:Uncharacterized protein n=1 Tax=Colletotrichum sidae TaxID=1347389 RepID=A0A4R8T1F8_9PEZI|nr:hypothetical protein C8034_v010961 [Colletotrichum sidae]